MIKLQQSVLANLAGGEALERSRPAPIDPRVLICFGIEISHQFPGGVQLPWPKGF
jgi:hypothetical protein